MPKMGESITEATITKWLVKEGDTIEIDDSIVEIATDKVDSEIPSPVDGKIEKLKYKEGDTVAVGEIIAIMQIEGEGEDEDEEDDAKATQNTDENNITGSDVKDKKVPEETEEATYRLSKKASGEKNFYSPLVRNIAKEENISMDELDKIKGSGLNGRVTKDDVLNYIENRGNQGTEKTSGKALAKIDSPDIQKGAEDEIIKMDRMRKLIADHMVMSKQVSPHVFSFNEIDVTNIVKWRNKHKEAFLSREGMKLTFTPIFLEAVAKALRDFPLVNISITEDAIIKRKHINLGMATALPNGNLIVPVIKDADQLNLFGITKAVNELAQKARESKLQPDDIQGGTFTLTNLGTFGTEYGMPIINQPQAAILAIGAIKKAPVVMETENGDVIAIRHIMTTGLGYDHRAIDGALGGKFLYRFKEYIESFNVNQNI